MLSVVLFTAGAVAQSKETGVIQGTVLDEGTVPLPGATITISSPKLMGTRSAITDPEGNYRIPAIPGGTYTVVAALEGFATVKKAGVVLHAGMTATVDMVLGTSKIETEVRVVAEAPLIDVTDASLSKTYVTQEMLQNIPTNQDASELLNLAPGVVDLSAYGGGDLTGNSTQIDGVDVTDARFGGGNFTMNIDYNVIEESQVMGLGAPAEYGNFSGAVVNVITKSGGNRFSGDAQAYYTAKNWQNQNIDSKESQWRLVPETPVTRLLDTSVHLGGPIIGDKLWFFAGFEYYSTNSEMPSTQRTIPTTWPKVFLKLTYQPTERDRIQAFVSYNHLDQKRVFYDTWIAPEANAAYWETVSVGNLSYLHTFSPSSIFELKIAGYSMKDAQDPTSGHDVSAHWDNYTGIITDNWYFYKWASSKAYQLNTSWANHMEDLIGSHDLKIGAEYGWGQGTNGFDYSGGVVYWDWDGQPDYAQSNSGRGTIIDTRMSFFVQDDWQITKSLVLNPGLRFSTYRGRVPDLNDRTVFKTTSLEPRIGFAWDLFKSHKTVLKGHFGRYFENMKTYYINEMTPMPDNIYYNVGPNWSSLTEWFRTPGMNNRSVDPDIKLPSMDQFVGGLEQVLGRDLSMSVSVIHRTWTNFIETVNIGAIFAPKLITNPVTGETMTIYTQTNRGTNFYYITNPKEGKDIGAAYPGVVGMTPWRKYTGLQVSLNKRLSHNWQANVSYLYGHETGNYSNSHTFYVTYGMGGSALFKDPNFQINSDGRSVISPPHTFKIQTTYMFPWGINLSANYAYHSGNTWTRTFLATGLGQGIAFIKAEPLGSQRLKATNNLDFRIEKSFSMKSVTVQAMLDMFNAFNQGIPTSMQVWGANMGQATAVSAPRTFRAGLRIIF
jgi:hypothetical protein